MKLSHRDILGIFFVIVLFIAAGYYSTVYATYLQELVGSGYFLGPISYILITILGTVVAPFSAIPLLPVAVTLWGPIPAALLSVIGWTLGGVFAYVLVQRYGRPLAEKFVDLDRAEQIAHTIIGKNQFRTVLLLRMIVPVDVLSYALGLFVTMPLVSYTVATLLGVMPFAFVFSFASTFPIIYQIVVSLVVIVLLILFWNRMRTKKSDVLGKNLIGKEQSSTYSNDENNEVQQ